jgi:hypothetical protein
MERNKKWTETSLTKFLKHSTTPTTPQPTNHDTHPLESGRHDKKPSVDPDYFSKCYQKKLSKLLLIAF